jgi:signal transduction histidine kinase
MYMTEQEINFGDPEYSGHYEIQIAPMMDTGTFEGIIVFLFNITENVKARLNAENARELSEKSSRSKSDFLTKMSDDIRTPMNTIIDTAELALRENKSPETENHILAIKEAGITLSSILNFSKTV